MLVQLKIKRFEIIQRIRLANQFLDKEESKLRLDCDAIENRLAEYSPKEAEKVQVVRPEEHLRLGVGEEKVLSGRQNEEAVIRIEHYLDKVGEELFEKTTGICAFFKDALLVHKDNLDVLA